MESTVTLVTAACRSQVGLAKRALWPRWVSLVLATFCKNCFKFLLSKTGKHCEMEQVPCASHPCEKGGVCRPSADYTSYSCRCPAGWQGTSALRFVMRQLVPQTASTNTNILVPFINYSFIFIFIHAFCVACRQVVAVTVLLINGTGPRCNEDVNECKKTPCKNGGRCINSQGSYVCKCQPGYSGHNCQIDIDDCTPSECFLHRIQFTPAAFKHTTHVGCK